MAKVAALFYRNWRLAFFAFIFCSVTDFAHAGMLIAPSAKWANLAFRPKTEEDTPNYYGYGGGLSLGYSIKQKFDLGLFANYLPGTRGGAKFGKTDAQLIFYGGEMALRLFSTIYLGVRGGLADYQLRKTTDTIDIPGHWSGGGGGFSLGAFFATSKRTFWQASIDIMMASIGSNDPQVVDKRTVEAFSLSIAYVYNGYESYGIENNIFGDYLKSFIFD